MNMKITSEPGWVILKKMSWNFVQKPYIKSAKFICVI